MKNEDKSKISFRTVWDIFMAVIFLALAILVIFTSFPFSIYEQREPETSEKIIRTMGGIILFLYSLIRLFRVYQKVK